MRKIKFRGKAKMSIEELNEMHLKHENGWVCGHLVMYGDTPYIVGDFLEVDQEYTVNEFWVPVHRESIGQYTGLKDGNGKEIYEKDIYHMGDKNITYTVVWHNTGLIGKRNSGRSYAGLEYWKDKIEVVGNVYENPELLDA